MGGTKNPYSIFDRHLKEREHLEIIDINGRLILNWIVEKCIVRCELNCVVSLPATLADFCEQRN